MKVAALDLGSNTFLLLIVEFNETRKSMRVIYDGCKVTRLAEGVNKTGVISQEALLRAEECFSDFQKIIRGNDVDKILGVATSAARDAKNSHDFFKLAEKYDIPVEIITGSREAELTFKGTLSKEEHVDGACVIDVGGGSTEIIGLQNKVIKGQSLNIGSVRLTEMFIKSFPTPKKQILEMEKYIENILIENQGELPKKVRSLIAVAGTPTTLASLVMKTQFDADRVNGFKITLMMLDEWIEKVGDLNLKQRLELTGMDSGREDVIVAGLCILRQTVKFFNLTEMMVSTQGVRYGLAASMVEAL